MGFGRRSGALTKHLVHRQDSPLKLAKVTPSLRTELAGANRAGSRKAPQLTLLVHEHASRDKRAVWS